jgi:hypothetical protein
MIARWFLRFFALVPRTAPPEVPPDAPPPDAVCARDLVECPVCHDWVSTEDMHARKRRGRSTLVARCRFCAHGASVRGRVLDSR